MLFIFFKMLFLSESTGRCMEFHLQKKKSHINHSLQTYFMLRVKT